MSQAAAAPEASGTLRKYPLPKLLYYLYYKQYTGRLQIGEGPTGSAVYLHEGMPVMARTAEQVDSVGQLLLRAGAIDDATYYQALMKKAQSGEEEDRILKQMGVATPEQIEHASRQVVLRQVSRLFRLRDTPFALYREQHAFVPTPEDAPRVRIHPRRVVYHGIRNAYDAERIIEEIGATLNGKVLRIDPKKAGHLERYKFDREDEVLLECLRAQFWTVPDLIHTVRRGDLEVWMMVYALLVTDVLELKPVGEASVAAPSPEVPQAGRLPVATPAPVPRTTTRPGVYRQTGIPGVRSPSSVPPTMARSGAYTPVGGSSPPPGTSPLPGMSEAPLTPEALALKQQIEDRLKVLDQQNHFDLLGVARDAPKETIKAAYIGLAKNFHPDRLAQFKLQSMRSEVERLFARISEAQATLLDDARRAEYVATLDGSARGDAEKARKILEAESAFQRGEHALRHKQYAEAEAAFRLSVELNPEEGEHHALLGWAMYQNPAHVRSAMAETAKQCLLRAIKLSRNNPRCYYLSGELLLSENDLDRAIGQFRKALELRENHVEAQRGLRLAIMRKEKGGGAPGEKKGGLFDRFKKK